MSKKFFQIQCQTYTPYIQTWIPNFISISLSYLGVYVFTNIGIHMFLNTNIFCKLAHSNWHLCTITNWIFKFRRSECNQNLRPEFPVAVNTTLLFSRYICYYPSTCSKTLYEFCLSTRSIIQDIKEVNRIFCPLLTQTKYTNKKLNPEHFFFFTYFTLL